MTSRSGATWDATVPEGLRSAVRGRPQDADGRAGPDDGDAWLTALPRLVAAALDRWSLTPDTGGGPARHGVCALVVPVRRDGEPAMLKLTWPHWEARTEHLALRHWAGRGAVRLLAADPASWTLLLERLDADRDLTREPVEDACAAIGNLLRELRRPAVPALPRLSAYAADLAGRLGAAAAAVPRRFVEQARSLARDLATADGVDGGVDGWLLHTDLHYANVLAGGRRPWLAIDPKPLAGDPAYEVAPALWNRFDEAVAGRDVRGHLRRRLAVVCEHGEIDEDRARAWTVVREVANAMYAAEEGDADRVTAAVAIVKAMSS